MSYSVLTYSHVGFSLSLAPSALDTSEVIGIAAQFPHVISNYDDWQQHLADTINYGVKSFYYLLAPTPKQQSITVYDYGSLVRSRCSHIKAQLVGTLFQSIDYRSMLLSYCPVSTIDLHCSLYGNTGLTEFIVNNINSNIHPAIAAETLSRKVSLY